MPVISKAFEKKIFKKFNALQAAKSPRKYNISHGEKLYASKINWVGGACFRPLVANTLLIEDSLEHKIILLKAIERFIFVTEKLGNPNNEANESISALAKDLYQGRKSTEEIADYINKLTDGLMKESLNYFADKIDKFAHTAEKKGYYAWGGLKYFLFEYENSLFGDSDVYRISWKEYGAVKEGKIAVEHILPNPTRVKYWKDLYNQYSKDEITLLSSSLGNMLPLSLQIDESAQDISFDRKKESSVKGRRKYVAGSWAAMEVAKNKNWDANTIYKRSVKLLKFMEQRWQIKFSKDQMGKLLYIDFAKEK